MFKNKNREYREYGFTINQLGFGKKGRFKLTIKSSSKVCQTSKILAAIICVGLTGSALAQAKDDPFAQALGRVLGGVLQGRGAKADAVSNEIMKAAVPRITHGSLFSNKSELLNLTREGKFLEIRNFSREESDAFVESVTAVLNNDYDIPAFPVEKAIRDGTQYMRTSSVCKGELASNVISLFRDTAEAYMATVSEVPPTFSNPNRDIESAKRNVNENIARLSGQRNGWCSSNGVAHPYLDALPKLLAEFDAVTGNVVQENRSKLQAQNEKVQAENLAIAKSSAVAERANAKSRADADRLNMQQAQSKANQRDTREKGAAARNAQKIKSLGFPQKFASSTLYVNYLGRWTELMPCSQWLGLLLENTKIGSVQPVTWRGHPGVSVKRKGNPAVGFYFRMEGNEAYVIALGPENRIQTIDTPAEHSQMSLLLKTMTDESAMQ